MKDFECKKTILVREARLLQLIPIKSLSKNSGLNIVSDDAIIQKKVNKSRAE